ncbi:MAG: UDP-N-acetylmuramoyl-L-alanine--D-glutamate ligase [Treponema sp.]|jgi:UDP-N-acetylmuramoylalanine--D-glutamate ligase|nr:UDP-N-acetylmuramoyl-L-alanine--D-glutamate ligase [Treponema sp.]
MADFSGRKVLIMGLGRHGGGIESAKYLARHGAELTITDVQDEKTLAPSIEKLETATESAKIRYVLGKHEMADFEKADLVIKNPGVRSDSPYLQAARRVETDISLFLARSPARLIAVTGSKGKSCTASALYWVLAQVRAPAGAPGMIPAVLPAEPARSGKALLPGRAWLGGNITVSPLSFLDRLSADDDVVLELSSWQLGDLRGRLKDGEEGRGKPLLKPRCAVITAIMPDHQDRYPGMEAYVADKRVIYQGQDREDATIAGRDYWGRSFLAESRGRPLSYGAGKPAAGTSGGWLAGPGCGQEAGFEPETGLFYGGTGQGAVIEVLPAKLQVPGRHQRINLLAAALALLDLGLPAESVREGLGSFPGIKHRLEFFYEKRGVRFYNDTAATIPEAAAAAAAAFKGRGRLLLVAGGSDKELNFEPFIGAAEQAAELFLLEGTGSKKLAVLLKDRGIPFRGPFDSLDAAVRSLLELARPSDIAVLSPGCASFGMFDNEFDRGDKWKEAVKRLA